MVLRDLAVLLLLLYAWPADAGCGGLRGEALASCLDAEQKMLENYRVQSKQLEALTLHYTFNGKPFTITGMHLAGDLNHDICGEKKKPGIYAQLDPLTKKGFETTRCAAIRKFNPRNSFVVAHGEYSHSILRIHGNYWCGLKVGAWITRDEKGAVLKTEQLFINDLQADCEAPPLGLRLVKEGAAGWTLR